MNVEREDWKRNWKMSNQFHNWISKSADKCFHGPYHATDIEKYLKCPQSVYYARVLGEGEQQRQNEAMFLGTIAHLFVEYWHNAVNGDEGIFEEDPLKMTFSSINDYVLMLMSLYSKDHKESRDVQLDPVNIAKLCNLLFEYTKWPNNNPQLGGEYVLLNEVSFKHQMQSDEGIFFFEGTIDRVRINKHNEVIVEDLKTNGLTSSSFSDMSRSYLQNSPQLMLYALAILSVANRDEIILSPKKKQGKTIFKQRQIDFLNNLFNDNKEKVLTTKLFKNDKEIDIPEKIITGKLNKVRLFLLNALSKYTQKSHKDFGKFKGNPECETFINGNNITNAKRSIQKICKLMDDGSFYRIGIKYPRGGDNCSQCQYEKICSNENSIGETDLIRPNWLNNE